MVKPTSHCSVFSDPPRNQVFLLSCMDLRLLDDTVRFMNRLNLQNRYDQLCLAGVSMGAMRLPAVEATAGQPQPLTWKSVFFAHLDAAINLLRRDIKDIFLLEHLDCGAYRLLHPDAKVRREYEKARDLTKMVKFHREEAHAFAEEIEAFCKAQHKLKAKEGNNAWKDIRVRCLLIDLIGNVSDL